MPRKKPLIAVGAAALCEPFGHTAHAAGCGTVFQMPLEGTRKEVRARIRERCSASPGVYGYVNRGGHLVYVGMSRNLRNRVQSYFTSNVRSKKETRISKHAVQLLWQPAVHPLIARLRELELIRRFCPAYNVEGHPWRMREGYIVLVPHAAGWFRLQSTPPAQFSGLWGPIPINRQTHAAVEELNTYFRLRDCPVSTKMHFSGEHDLIPAVSATGCLRAATQTCLAPCVGECSRLQYAKAITQARRFLDGKDTTTLNQLAAEMRAASQELRFERALRLRDAQSALERLDQYLRRFHDWREQATFVYPVTDSGAVGERWLVIVRGVVQSILAAPISNIDRTQTAELLNALITSPHQAPIDLTANQFQSARVVHAWFRKYPAETERRLSLRQALARCRHKKGA